MSNEEIKKLDLRGEICPYPMLKTNEELDSNKDINILEVITDHSPALKKKFKVIFCFGETLNEKKKK